MKKFWKIFFITVVSIISILLVTISVILFLVFTPERFTPIVRKQVDKLITCKSDIGDVELTFFSTFPDFGIKIRQFALINPVMGSQSDTLVKAGELVGVLDAAAWWKRNELILTGLELTGGSVNVFSDSLGKTNYDIFASDTTSATEASSGSEFPVIDIRNVVLNDINLSYNDLALKLNAAILNLSAKISGKITPDHMSGNLSVKKSLVSVEYGGEKYMSMSSVNFDIPVDVVPSRQFIQFNDAKVSVNDLELLLSGSIEDDTINRNIITDIKYEFASWQVEDMLAIVPPSYKSYFKGVVANGLLSSDGTIKGVLGDSAMPILDLHFSLAKGTIKYSGFPLPLHDVGGDISVYTDLKSDALSFVKIKEFNARTPLSAIRIEGLVNHLFSDIYCDLTTTAGLTLDEFNPVIPDSMKLRVKGKASGKVRSSFTLSQLEKMQLERMKLSGSVTLLGFKAAYDSISLETDHSKIDFALPNTKASLKKTKFASATLLIDNIRADKLESYTAYLQNAAVTFETSDIRDTTRIPDFICSFKMDSLSANLDTMSIAINKPYGRVTVSPGSDKPHQPGIILSYSSEMLKTMMGHSSFTANSISFDTDIRNDNTQKDFFLQWVIKGFIDMNHGIVNLAGLSHPIEIPSVKMDFDPETFNIREGKIQIDKSDFQLTGNLHNILSYFKGDSILRGEFNFVSTRTDVAQLMALTSGIGYKDSTAAKKPDNQDTDTTYTGPYMVPKRIDMVLNVDVKKATLGVDTASRITGKVQVHDGILVLDGLTFETPAARMQLTAMYRTPRKNHLFLGLDYHMMDVEISQLLTMIPDIDSLMPMLRSFKGKGEFHIAVETYLDSLYNIKKSTLRGASSIKGNDLVLMDGQTFSEIAKTLKFNKRTENRVDSLSAEFTIFRDEIDVYPFLLVMDKYKAVIAGRHNFDLTYDYHISVVDCPLPIKLGVDVKGNADDFSFKLAKCRYAEYYRPSSRHSVENKQMELRKMIRETLMQKLIE